ALLLSSYTADSVGAIGRVRSGVKAATLPIGGRTVDEARSTLTNRARLLMSTGASLYAEGKRESVTPAAIGFTPRIEPTLAEAMAIGRSGNLVVRIWHRLRSLFVSTDVGWHSSVDAAAARRLVA